MGQDHTNVKKSRLDLPISAQQDFGIKRERLLCILESIKACLERTRTIQYELYSKRGRNMENCD